MAPPTTRPFSERRAAALLAAAFALVWSTGVAMGCPDGGKRKDKPMTYAEAVALLRSSETMCKGAEALAKIGDKKALIELFDAHSSAEETAAKQCVKQAMKALGAEGEAKVLAASASPEERHRGIAFMGMFRADAHLPLLGGLIAGDPDPSVRAHAVEVLWLQKRTGPWESLMIKSLDHGDVAVRRTAAQALTGQWGAGVLGALRKRLAVEKEAVVRDKLQAAIREHEAHGNKKK